MIRTPFDPLKFAIPEQLETTVSCLCCSRVVCPFLFCCECMFAFLSFFLVLCSCFPRLSTVRMLILCVPWNPSLVFCLVSSWVSSLYLEPGTLFPSNLSHPGHNCKNGYASNPGLRWCHRLVFRSCKSLAFREATWRGSTHFFEHGEDSGYVYRAGSNTTKPLEAVNRFTWHISAGRPVCMHVKTYRERVLRSNQDDEICWTYWRVLLDESGIFSIPKMAKAGGIPRKQFFFWDPNLKN